MKEKRSGVESIAIQALKLNTFKILEMKSDISILDLTELSCDYVCKKN